MSALKTILFLLIFPDRMNPVLGEISAKIRAKCKLESKHLVDHEPVFSCASYLKAMSEITLKQWISSKQLETTQYWAETGYEFCATAESIQSMLNRENLVQIGLAFPRDRFPLELMIENCAGDICLAPSSTNTIQFRPHSKADPVETE